MSPLAQIRQRYVFTRHGDTLLRSDADDPPVAPPKSAKPPTAEQVAKYLRADLSLAVLGPVAPDVFDERMAACESCEHIVRDEKGDYCGKCGCGGRERARLNIKLHMPKAACPVEKWGEAEGTGVWQLRRVGGALKQVRGIIKQTNFGLRDLVKAWKENSKRKETANVP